MMFIEYGMFFFFVLKLIFRIVLLFRKKEIIIRIGKVKVKLYYNLLVFCMLRDIC